jgi:hypothetical protein
MAGPRRSKSVSSYLWETRAIAAIALLALVAGVVSDLEERRFWARHSLIAGLASGFIVVMLTVALVNEAVERRRRQRWSVLAQYVMLQLVRGARGIWMGLLELAGAVQSDAGNAAAIDDSAQLVRDTDRLRPVVQHVLAEPVLRTRFHNEIAETVVHNDEVLGRWAGVMLNTDRYVEIIDRHVELASDLAWLGSLLDNLAESDEDDVRRRASRSHPAVQVTGMLDDDQLADRIVVITQLAEELDRLTLQIALRIVPLEWWAARLGTTASEPRASR